MPNSDSGVPYPSDLFAPDGAAQMMALAYFLDNHTVLHATDEADRDALWGDFPAPVVVVSKSRPAAWLKVADAGTSTDWRVIYEDTGWVTDGTPFAAATGFEAGETLFRRKNGIVHAAFSLNRTGADIASNSSGNIANVQVGSLTTPFRPKGYAGLQVTSVGQYVGVFAFESGSVSLGHMLPSVSWDNGTLIRCSGMWIAGDA